MSTRLVPPSHANPNMPAPAHSNHIGEALPDPALGHGGESESRLAVTQDGFNPQVAQQALRYADHRIRHFADAATLLLPQQKPTLAV